MKFIKFSLHIFTIFLFFYGCTPEEIVSPPEKATLLFPINNEIDIEVPVRFSWDLSNKENEALTYVLYLTDDTLSNEWVKYFTSEKHLEVAEENLLPLTTYYWKIEVLYLENSQKSISSTHSFKTAFFGEEPEAPKARLLSPNNNSTDLTQPVSLLWEVDGLDNEILSFAIYITTDTLSSNPWKSYETNNNNFIIEDSLLTNTKYFWKVETKSVGKRNSYSEIFSFTTQDIQPLKTHYADGEVLQLQKAIIGAGVNIVILGDGFIKDDLTVGGNYEKSAIRAMEAFFQAEPYLSYRDYFNFYTVFAESNQRGADYETLTSGLKDTKFDVSFDASSASSTFITTNNNLCWEYSKKAPGCENIDKTLVVVMINSSRIAGYCHFWIQGRAIALCPITPKSSPWNQQFENLILHEAGGHGFAKLADEYLKYPTQSINGTDATAKSYKSTLMTGINAGIYANVDITNDPEKVKWRDLYINYPDKYKYVRSVEGAFYYGKDVFRPEPNSCMINNIKYYNAPSRMAIVKRIKFLAGESFSLADFVDKDRLLNFPPQNAVD